MGIVFVLSIISGAAALVFEAVFLRQLTWLLGSSVTATALVLSAFLGGMALGAASLGPVADRNRRPLRLYGLIEAIAGLSGAIVVYLLATQRGALLAPLRWIGPGAGREAAGFVLALCLLLAPAFLIGASLPALSRFLVRSNDSLLGRLGLLYALNTLGGAAGALLAGFYLFERLGISASGYLAAILDLGVGAAALLLDRARGAAWESRAAQAVQGHHGDRAEEAGGAGGSPRLLAGQDLCGHRADRAEEAGGAGGSPRLLAGQDLGGHRADRAEEAGGAGGSPRLRAVCLLAAGLGGFAALGYEVLWTRLLSLPLRSYSYSFSLMLALFLTGIVLGGLVVAAVSARIRRPAALLGWAQIGMGVTVASSLIWFADLLGSPIEAEGFGNFVARAASRAALIVLPPTILSGIAFPLAARVVAGPVGGVGRSVGLVYAVNTLGAVGGALVARFALLPFLGASRSLAVLAAINAASGAIVVHSAAREDRLFQAPAGSEPPIPTAARGRTPAPATRGRTPARAARVRGGAPDPRAAPGPRATPDPRTAQRSVRPAKDRGRLSFIAAILLACACGAAILLPNDRFVSAFLDASRGREKIAGLLFFHEGATDTIAIVKKNYGFYDPEAKTLITNSISMSATARPVWRYMAAEGHLPVLFARDPKRALVLCVGTGITLGAVASHPGLEAIDAVDLSEGVALGLPYFASENGRPWEDPRVRMVREDGRHFLELGGEPYDVITLEPPPPIVAGSAHLYSLDFYRILRARLVPGGVVAQWLPLHSQSLESARMTARTFAEAFPYVQLWLPSIRDAVLLGSDRPLRMDLDAVRRAWSEPRTRTNLAAAYLESPEALLACYLLDREGLLRWAEGFNAGGGPARIGTAGKKPQSMGTLGGGAVADADAGGGSAANAAAGGGSAADATAREGSAANAAAGGGTAADSTSSDGPALNAAAGGGTAADATAGGGSASNSTAGGAAPGTGSRSDPAVLLTDEHPWMEFFRRQGRNMRDREIATLTSLQQGPREWVDRIDADPSLSARVEAENRALRLYLQGGIEEDSRASTAAAVASRGTEFFLSTLGCASAQLAYMAKTPQWATLAEAQARKCAALRSEAAAGPR